MKKIIAFMVAALMVMQLVCVSAFAAESNYDTLILTDPVPPPGETKELVLTDPVPPYRETQDFILTDPVPPTEKYVATMYLCATTYSVTGHMWLYFENLTDHNIDVGYVTVCPGGTISVGCLRNSRADGGGTYYNGEAFMAKNLQETGNHTWYLSKDITEAELRKVSEAICSHNIYSIVGYNCTNFACDVWNTVASIKMIPLCLPALNVLLMSLVGAQKGLVMERPTIDNVYKQTSNGVFQASPSSFKASCVG